MGMTLLLLGQITLAVVILTGVTIRLVTDDSRAVLNRARDRMRNRADAPYLGLLIAVLAVTAVVRWYQPEIAWHVGREVSNFLYLSVSWLVPWLQQFASPPVTLGFSVMYMVGFAFLLVSPLILYAGLEDPAPLRETMAAYSVNLAIGLLGSFFIIAYAPRHFSPRHIEPLLYSAWPDAYLLTSRTSSMSSVFPSLRMSLSFTVVLLAIRTRDHYARWLPVAAVFASSVTLATLYLGMNWPISVPVGVLIALVSVTIAARVPAPEPRDHVTTDTQTNNYLTGK